MFLFQVHIKSPFILNGVCVRWKGYIDLERLDGAGCVEFDEESATLEDAILKVSKNNYFPYLSFKSKNIKTVEKPLIVRTNDNNKKYSSNRSNNNNNSTNSSRNNNSNSITC